MPVSTRACRAAVLAGVSLALAQTPVFRSTTNLQSIAVQVLDNNGNFVPGLTAADFTLLEDGHPQKIAFFGAEQQPVSLAILLDSSRSMDFGRKFDRAREFIAPLMAGHSQNDQIFLMPFTDKIEAFEQLTREQRLHPELVQTARGGDERGTALYDALASALCRMRTADNLRQAVVMITDGADQHSRLNLEQLIELAQMSTPQIFMIGFFSRAESQVFHERQKTIKLLGEREIDNPMLVFERLAKESGAESFFPSSEQDLKAALGRISEMLQAQYTLAYYPQQAGRFRKIDVRVRRGGVKVIARRGVGASSQIGPVHFEASTCEVSAKDHPLRWELKTVRSVSGELIYHEDFSDPESGWPNRREQIPTARPATLRQLPEGGGEYQPGLRYVPGGYQISRHPPAGLTGSGPVLDGAIGAYGPPFDNVRAAVSVQTEWSRAFHLQPGNAPAGEALPYAETVPGLVFHFSERGYYAVLLAGTRVKNAAGKPVPVIDYELRRTLFNDDGQARETDLIPWTPVSSPAAEISSGGAAQPHKISVEYQSGQIAVSVDDQRLASVHDDTLPNGLTGLAVFGKGDAIFHDLLVQDLP
ncbi:MAG TPA: VWA domain-containing protein [Bryobacteraceae bacterium]|nr:VWA domain-containing protein [Bryobacteraceae bacterium]